MKKNLFIVVEGPDGSGKTSIAKKLAEKLNFYYFERPKKFKVKSRKPEKPEYYENLLRKLSKHLEEKLKKKNIVIARYLYSIPALCYSKTKEKVEPIDDVIKPDYIVYCYADKKTLQKRIFEREIIADHEKDKAKYNRLCKRYKELLWNKKETIRINTSNKTIDESVDKILKKIKIIN